MGRDVEVPRDRQWQLVGRPRQKSDFTIELWPVIETLREPEHELVIHELRSRAPTLAEEDGAPHRQTEVLTFDLSPVRSHDDAVRWA